MLHHVEQEEFNGPAPKQRDVHSQDSHIGINSDEGVFLCA
jgi:hypothetical protein